MNRFVSYVFMAVLMLVSAPGRAVACGGGSGAVHYTKADSSLISGLLAEAGALPEGENVPLFFARKFLGRPYVAHTLEIFDDERLVVNTAELDCTTLVETVTALTLCVYRKKFAFGDYLGMLKCLRYRGGVMSGYTSRLHYFSDWIDDKRAMGLVEEIHNPVPPFTALQRLGISYMSAHSGAYKALAAHPEFVPEIRRQEKALTGRTYRYIPKSAVAGAAVKKAVRDGDIIAITCRKKGLDIAHLGFAVWRKDGLHLLNASMLHHKVVEEPMTLYRYLQKHPTHTGIRIVRINR